MFYSLCKIVPNFFIKKACNHFTMLSHKVQHENLS